MKSQTCTGVSFLANINAMIGPYLVTKLVQLARRDDGKILQAFSNSASTAATDRLDPRALFT
jgi:hypothetical protein